MGIATKVECLESPEKSIHLTMKFEVISSSIILDKPVVYRL